MHAKYIMEGKYYTDVASNPCLQKYTEMMEVEKTRPRSVELEREKAQLRAMEALRQRQEQVDLAIAETAALRAQIEARQPHLTPPPSTPNFDQTVEQTVVTKRRLIL